MNDEHEFTTKRKTPREEAVWQNAFSHNYERTHNPIVAELAADDAVVNWRRAERLKAQEAADDRA